MNSVLVQWAAEALLQPSDRVTLLHSPRGLGANEALFAAGQLVNCETILRPLLLGEARRPAPALSFVSSVRAQTACAAG